MSSMGVDGSFGPLRQVPRRRLRIIAPQSFAQKTQIVRTAEDFAHRIQIIDQRADHNRIN